jgi:hypothetical protein
MVATVSLQLVAVIDEKIIPIKTVDYSESIREMISDGHMDDSENDIVEYLTSEFYDGDSGI